MYFLYLKALHIIFVITWFAGLFYIVRLFVYYAEASALGSPEKEILTKQYKLMQKRLWYGITWPSAVITAVLGTLLVIEYGAIPFWLACKLGFVVILYVYHVKCHFIFKSQQQGTSVVTSRQMRIWNEVATILLVCIVFLVVIKNLLSIFWGIIGVALLSILLFFAIRLYALWRKSE
jgi:putative membrane protein